MKMRLGFLSLLFVSLSTTSAHALDLSVLGGLNFYSPSRSGLGVDSTSKPALAYGAYLGWGYTPGTELEVGLLKVNRKTKFGNTVTASHSAVEIPISLRLVMIPFMSLGGGVYYARISQDAGTRQDDYGLRLSARLELPAAPLVDFLVEANYVYGLRDLAASDTWSLKNREIQALVGVKLGF